MPDDKSSDARSPTVRTFSGPGPGSAGVWRPLDEDLRGPSVFHAFAVFLDGMKRNHCEAKAAGTATVKNSHKCTKENEDELKSRNNMKKNVDQNGASSCKHV